MRIKKEFFDAKWFDYDGDVRLYIRPFANIESMHRDPTSLTPHELSEFTWNRFKYCLLDWEGIKDCNCDEDECECPKLEVTEENKLKIFNLLDNLVVFVTTKEVELRIEVQRQLKN